MKITSVALSVLFILLLVGQGIAYAVTDATGAAPAKKGYHCNFVPGNKRHMAKA